MFNAFFFVFPSATQNNKLDEKTTTFVQQYQMNTKKAFFCCFSHTNRIDDLYSSHINTKLRMRKKWDVKNSDNNTKQRQSFQQKLRITFRWHIYLLLAAEKFRSGTDQNIFVSLTHATKHLLHNIHPTDKIDMIYNFFPCCCCRSHNLHHALKIQQKHKSITRHQKATRNEKYEKKERNKNTRWAIWSIVLR